MTLKIKADTLSITADGDRQMTYTSAYKFAKAQYKAGKFAQFFINKSDVCSVYWLEADGYSKAFATEAAALAEKENALKRAAKFI